jgi:peroxiredoxin
MVLTPSSMLALGTAAPGFSLPDTDGRTVSIGDYSRNRALLMMFICPHCPYVQHVRQVLGRLGGEWQGKGVAVVAINSNDLAAHPEDGPDGMRQEKREAGYTFPYLFDGTQEVARAYKAACTPDFFLFGSDRRLVYRGQMDGSRPGNEVPVTGADLTAAIDAVLAGRPAPSDQRPSMGCNIKWKPGNASGL